MEKVEVAEQCALCLEICDTPQTFPCGDIVCSHHCLPIVLGQQCPIFILEHILRASCPGGHEALSTMEAKDEWYGMGTKRGRERYIASPCKSWLFCGHEACYLSHQKRMGLKRGRQKRNQIIELFEMQIMSSSEAHSVEISITTKCSDFCQFLWLANQMPPYTKSSHAIGSRIMVLRARIFSSNGAEKMFEFECPICLDFTIDPYVPPDCQHFNCRRCFDTIQPVNGFLSCPQCRKLFKLDDIKPYEPPLPSIRYCLDLTCQPGSGCTKVHIDDLCKIPETTTPPTQQPVEDEREDDDAIFQLPKDATYCTDICCPGGKDAKCRKWHEADLNLRALAT
ncbi:Tripartite motif-containing protein 26 [Taenia solium]|eukprot:TsM_000948300 transcript=TsM_000948300 gene=TsM_000948300